MLAFSGDYNSNLYVISARMVIYSLDGPYEGYFGMVYERLTGSVVIEIRYRWEYLLGSHSKFIHKGIAF